MFALTDPLENNWIVNASPEPTSAPQPIVSDEAPPEPLESEWQPDVFKTNPTALLLDSFRAHAKNAPHWATRSLAERKAANNHEDFYPTMIAHAVVLLKPRVAPERVARWESDIRSFDPA